ncbi:MAG: hypothetical protein ACPG4T_07385 [Nannocystaceae bacterium]
MPVVNERSARCSRSPLGRLLTGIVAAALATSPTQASAGPAPSANPARTDSPEDKQAVETALAAWEKGRWIEVRGLLDPLVQGGRKLKDPILHEKALRHLADATLSDESIDAELRTQLAAAYIDRLLAEDPEWRPPEGIHNATLYSMAADLRSQRDRIQFDLCLAERAACAADREDLQERYKDLSLKHENLKTAYAEQEVEVRETVARNRAIALVPFGVGNFYNGHKGIGATFLTAEIILGGIGIGLFSYRQVNCSRQLDGVLDCRGESAPYVARRNAEQFFGGAIIAALVADVVVAQIMFKPYKSQEVRRVKRSELTDKDGRPPPRRKPRKRRNKRKADRDKLQARPVPTFLPGGAGMGMSFRF